MLKQRVLVAVPLIIVALLILFSGSNKLIAFVSALLTLYGAFEWSQFLPLKKVWAKLVYVVIVAALGLFFATYFIFLPFILIMAIFWWVVCGVWVVRYGKSNKVWANGIWAKGFSGLIFFPAAWLSFNVLYDVFDPVTVLFMLLMVWAADIGAYFAGRAFGKKKLMPAVSPNKTWEGALGGLIAVLIVNFIMIVFFLKADLGYWDWTLLTGFLVFIFALFGDLVESLMKREAGVKDSGNLLPGHGGLLDRLDSTLAVAPVFLTCLLLSQHLY